MQLCNLCKSITNTISKNKEQVIFLNTGDILNGKILNFKYSKVSSLPGQAKKTIKNNDILFSEIRPKNGRYALVNVENPNDFVVSTKLMVIRCDDIVLPKYLYYYLTSPKIISHLQELAESRSGTFPQITFDEIKSLNIDLPSKDFQQHIVNIIGSIDDLIEHKISILTKLEEFEYFIYLKENLNDEKTLLFDKIQFIKGKKPTTFNDNGEKYLTIDALENGNFTYTNDKKLVYCEENNILMVMDGASSGKVYIGHQGIVGSTLAKISTNINPYYLYIFLKNNFKNISEHNTGSAIPHTNKDIIYNLKISNNIISNKTYEKLLNIRISLNNEINKLRILKNNYLKKFFG